MTGHVIAVGGANLDTLARVTGDPDDPRPVLGTSNPGRTSHTAGGVARNVAENLARLGTPVRLVAAVGDDAVGDTLLADLADLGVDVSGVRRRALPTGSYTAVLDHRGELVVGVADMAATESLAPSDLPDDAFAGAGWVVLDGNLVPATVDRCLALAASAGVPVALDPVGVAKAARLQVTGRVHTFTPTREELAAFTGTAEVAAAVAIAHDRGIDTVWLREGAGGSTIHRRGTAPVRVQLAGAAVVDVTGAGDAMLAGYVHRMLAGSPVVEAARFGAAAAWLTVASSYTVRTDLTAELVAETLARLDPTREGAR
ncbi:MAG TPA: carbohydrate kinase family protein [Marmoricola sp.]